jgi:uncharacterized membrane protein YgcG
MRKPLSVMLAAVLLLATAGAAMAASRSIPAQNQSMVTIDTQQGLPGSVKELKEALGELSAVHYQVIAIDDTQGEDREAYLDRVLAQWGWPEADTLLVVVYDRANFDVRFAMGADFRAQNVMVEEMVGLFRTHYFPAARQSDPALGLHTGGEELPDLALPDRLLHPADG